MTFLCSGRQAWLASGSTGASMDLPVRSGAGFAGHMPRTLPSGGLRGRLKGEASFHPGFGGFFLSGRPRTASVRSAVKKQIPISQSVCFSQGTTSGQTRSRPLVSEGVAVLSRGVGSPPSSRPARHSTAWWQRMRRSGPHRSCQARAFAPHGGTVFRDKPACSNGCRSRRQFMKGKRQG